MKAIKKVLVAVDLSEPSKEVIEASVQLARTLDASLELVHVREPFVYAIAGQYGPSSEQEQALVRWIQARLDEESDRINHARVPCVTTSLYGSPAREIVTHAEKVGADLIVVGTHGHGGIAHAVLGSVAERIVQKAKRPVLTIPIAT
jgi:nucleotide-binding universal stress UspA family protein